MRAAPAQSEGRKARAAAETRTARSALSAQNSRRTQERAAQSGDNAPVTAGLQARPRKTTGREKAAQAKAVATEGKEAAESESKALCCKPTE